MAPPATAQFSPSSSQFEIGKLIFCYPVGDLTGECVRFLVSLSFFCCGNCCDARVEAPPNQQPPRPKKGRDTKNFLIRNRVKLPEERSRASRRRFWRGLRAPFVPGWGGGRKKLHQTSRLRLGLRYSIAESF